MSQLVTYVHVVVKGHKSEWFGPSTDASEMPDWAFEATRHNPLLWDVEPEDRDVDVSVKSSVAAGDYVLNAAVSKLNEAESDLEKAQDKAKRDLEALNDELEKPKPAPAKKAPARKATAKKAAPKTGE